MKILLPKQIREVDAKTLAYDNISSKDLMYKASSAFYNYFQELYGDVKGRIAVVCGTGNNGGDGVTVATLLYNVGRKVDLFIIESSGRGYADDMHHYYKIAKGKNIPIGKIRRVEDIPSFEDYGIIIDAIFGTGINRPVEGIYSEVIDSINSSGGVVVSLDVPSGVIADRKTEKAVRASATITLEVPKLALFLPDNNRFVGQLHRVDFGLSAHAIAEAPTDMFYITEQMVRGLLKPIDKFAHKGTQGHALIIGGSLGKIGSVCLASKGALRAGTGLVTAYVPRCGTVPLQAALPEAMVIEDGQERVIGGIDFDLNPDAIGVGVGMGTANETANAFLQFLKVNQKPLVIDADAINILSKNRGWLSHLQAGTILTPHPKELSRLIGEWDNDFEKIDRARELAVKYDINIVIKGAHTLIVTPDKLYVNSSGTPALATAGSGDVLTGIITALLAQGYTPKDAAIIGVYIHGYTANLSEGSIHLRSFIASDIIEGLSGVFMGLRLE